MRLSEYLIESILSKKTGIYRLRPETGRIDWKEIVSWLEGNGFEEETDIIGFGKNRMCYNIGIPLPDGTPCYLAIHAWNMEFAIDFDDTTKSRNKVKSIQAIDVDDTAKSRASKDTGWKETDLEHIVDFIEKHS